VFVADSPGEWLYAMRLDDLWDGEFLGVRVGIHDVLLANIGGEIHAYDNRCPHAGSRLSDGVIRGRTLRCAAHHWEFDIRTGAGVNPRNCALQRYAVSVMDGAILLRPEVTQRASH
jgi:toluene monooxygenase system ferredoxin subunit